MALRGAGGLSRLACVDIAVLTVVAGVIGAVLGAIGSGVMSLISERRREKAAARVAAGFVRRELRSVLTVLDTVLGVNGKGGTGRWWTPEDAPSLEAWEKHGPALLTGEQRSRASLFHDAVLGLASMTALAESRYAPVIAAEQRLTALDEGAPVQRSGNESEDQARDRERDETKANLANALAATKLGREERPELDSVRNLVRRADEQVPKEPWSPLTRRVARWTSLVAVCVLALLLLPPAIDQAVLSRGEVAVAVGQALGAQHASCDPVDKVDGQWRCSLAYAAPAAAQCSVSAPLRPARPQFTAAALVPVPTPLATSGPRVAPVAATAKQVVSYDEARREFLATQAKMTVAGLTEKDKRCWKQVFKDKAKPVLGRLTK